MTESDIIAHWRKGARDSLEVAELAHDAGKFSLALFHCHLAAEKALKAAFIEKNDDEPPYTHDLTKLALLIRQDWSGEHKNLLGELTDYAIAARYDDPGWAERQAIQLISKLWIQRTRDFLSFLIP